MCPHGSPSAEAIAQEPANSSDSSPARALTCNHCSSYKSAGQVSTMNSFEHSHRLHCVQGRSSAPAAAQLLAIAVALAMLLRCFMACADHKLKMVPSAYVFKLAHLLVLSLAGSESEDLESCL